MKEKVKRYILNNRNYVLIIFLFYALAASLLPYRKIAGLFSDSLIAADAVFIVSRAILSIIPLVAAICLGNASVKDSLSSLLVIPFFLLAANNFPIISIANKSAALCGDGVSWLVHILKCAAVAVFEEYIFRGIIFALLLESFKGKSLSFAKSSLISSAAFGLMHAVNLVSGESIEAVALQVSYSFLLGVVFSISYVLTGKVFIAAALHFIFDFGGLLQDSRLIVGTYWSSAQLAETAILAIIVAAYAVTIFIKINLKTEKDFESGSTEG